MGAAGSAGWTWWPRWWSSGPSAWPSWPTSRCAPSAATRRNRGRSIRTGLWAHSRHPNYLGEIATWWGLWLFALAAAPRWWWTVIGAAAITVMFVFVSVPMMEKRALATREGYREYRGPDADAAAVAADAGRRPKR